MKRFVIIPLLSDYTYIPISSTELEAFAKPIEDFKKIIIDDTVKDREYYDKIQMKDEVFSMGSYVESIIQATLLFWEEQGMRMARKVRENLNSDFTYYKRAKLVNGKPTNKEREFIYNNLENYVTENLKLFNGVWYYNTTNYRMHSLIECWPYLFWFSWEVDTARFYWEGDDIIIDHKLSASEWKEDTLEKKRQMYYYPFLAMLGNEDIKEIKFIYNVNRKLKNISWKTQNIEYTVSRDEAFNTLIHDIKKYAKYLNEWWEQQEHKDLSSRL